MTRPRALLAVGAGLAVHLALLAGLPGAIPAPLRVGLAFVTVVLLPGYAFVAAGAMPPGGPWFSPGWALGFGIAWNGVLVLLTRILGLPFTVLVGGSALATAVLWALVLWRGPRGVTVAAPPRGAALAAVLLAAALAGGYAARLGPPMGYRTDSPDHIGTIRRMLESGDAFPNDAYFRDAGRLGADPRKGLWHSDVALIARLAAADPAETWRALPALILPLMVLNVAALGWMIAGAAGAAIAACAVVVTYGGGLTFTPIRQAVFPWRLADHLAIATVVAVLADLGQRRALSRLAALGLGFAAVVTHLYAAFEFAVVFGALAVGLWVRDRRLSAEMRRLIGTASAIAAASAPYLLWRMREAYAPSNIIHTEPQGLLFLAGSLRVAQPNVLLGSVGWAWVLFPLAWWWLWKRGRGSAPVLCVLTNSLSVFLLIFNPWAVALLEPRVGYLLMRVSSMLWLPALLAWAVPELCRALVRPRAPRVRLRAAAGLGLILITSWPALGEAAFSLSHLDSMVAAERVHSPAWWRDALEWMDRHLEPGRVVLSDPVTSYSVPMMSRHYVATLVDQHSSPNDSLALTRILDARDALDPYGSWDRTRQVLRRYRVDVIALNDRFREPPLLDYWESRPAWFAAARARLDRHPEAFERLFDTGDFVIYGVRAAALDRLNEAPPPRPFVTSWSPGRWPAGRNMGEGLPLLQGFGLWPAVGAPGDSVRGVVEWRVREPVPPGSYLVAVRFDRPLPGGFTPPAFIGKPVRKLIEWRHHERYRFRADHLPTGGGYGVDLWRPNEVVRDSFEVAVPLDVAEGQYRVQVRMVHQPHYENLRLSDYFLDTDLFAGLHVGTFEVRRRGASPVSPAPAPAPGASGGP